MIQAAFSNRIQQVIKQYVQKGIKHHPLQFGFKKDRTVQEAAILVRLLLERANRRQEPLMLTSKDCLKCYDRVPGWVMEYLYIQKGVPEGARTLMKQLLEPGPVEVRTGLGWLAIGDHAFGIGQGSILVILHIGVFFDCLLYQQNEGPGLVIAEHRQGGEDTGVGSIKFVDDGLDLANTKEGIRHRTAKSNRFMGKHGTTSTYGAHKSFFLQVNMDEKIGPPELVNGEGIPRPVTVVAPAEGFKHLGVQQSTEDQWSQTLQKLWNKTETEAQIAISNRLTIKEANYLIECVWAPRVAYRASVADIGNLTAEWDKLARKVLRAAAKISYGAPNEIYHNPILGIGV